jgi:hypothetical protein
VDQKAIKRFKKLVKDYGVVVEGKGGHMAVLHNGRRISTLSHTGDINACRASMADLVRAGVVPAALKQEKFS